MLPKWTLMNHAKIDISDPQISTRCQVSVYVSEIMQSEAREYFEYVQKGSFWFKLRVNLMGNDWVGGRVTGVLTNNRQVWLTGRQTLPCQSNKADRWLDWAEYNFPTFLPKPRMSNVVGCFKEMGNKLDICKTQWCKGWSWFMTTTKNHEILIFICFLLWLY